MPSVAEARVTINKLLEAVDWYAAFVSVAVGGLRWTWGGGFLGLNTPPSPR